MLEFGLIVLIFLVVSLPPLNKHFGIWACNLMGWHLAPIKQSFDGCSYGGKCPRCNKDVLLDSQGNWFEKEWRY
jgi:hypothetical protein